MAKLNVKTGQSAGIVDFFNWKRFSSLQKLLTIATVVIGVSWLSSLWTLLILFLLCVAGALKLSNNIGHQETGPLLAENIILKLEEAFMWSCNILNNFKMCLRNNHYPDIIDSGDGGQRIVDDTNMFVENESDKLFETPSSTNVIPVPVRSEINSLQLLIIRDFVQSWYSTFSYNNQFLKESKCVIQQSCNNLAVSLSRQNPQVITTSLLKIVRAHLTMYMKAKSVFDSHQIHPKTKVPTGFRRRHTSLEEAFEREFGFHEALKTEEDEINYLRGIISIVLLSSCPKATTDGICTRTLLVEIITNNVFLAVIHMMSDPDWLMEIIILLTSQEEDCMENVEKERGNSDYSEEAIDLYYNCVSNETSTSSDENASGNKETSDVTDSLHEEEDNEAKLSKTYLTIHPEHLKDAQLNSGDQELSPDEENGAQYSETVVESLKSTADGEDKNGNSHGEHFIERSLQRSPCEMDHEEENETVTLSSAKMSHTSKDKVDESINLGNSPHESITNDIKEDNIFFKCNQELSESISADDPQIVNHQNSLLHDLSLESADKDEPYDDSDTGSFTNIILESDPQSILSYGKSIPLPASDSLKTQGSVKTQLSEQPLSSTFPKLSSIKSFLVDSFKTSNKNSSVQKPKSLDLVSSNHTSFNHLSSSKAKNSNQEISQSNSNDSPPIVLVDGKPAENVSAEKNSFRTSQSSGSDSESSSTRVEKVVSPGFFASFHFQPFFSKSVSQNDLSASNLEVLEESPVITPSPTDATSLDLDISEQKQIDLKLLEDLCMSGDQKIFQDISIPCAFTNQEFRSSSQYSLYVIEYHALYFTEEGKTVLKTGEVKRRHREFTNLQSRLESLPSFKKYMKKIRGPRRWPTLPFKSLDKETVESRRQFLEKYLQNLISIEAICNGPDLREFLAYEGDSHIAFVRKSPDISVPRIDKMFMRGVSEVVDKIKSIPNIPSEVMSGLRSKEDEKSNRPGNQFSAEDMEVNMMFAREGTESTGSILDYICHQLSYDHDNRIKDDFDHLNMSHVIKDLKSYERTQETYRQEVEKLLSNLPKTHMDGTEKGSNEEVKPNQPPNMCPVLLELLVQGLQGRDNWVCNEQVVKLVQAFLGKAVNSYMESTIKDLTSDKQLVIYLRLLRETIWPQGQLWSDSQPPKSDWEKAATRAKAKTCLQKFFPWILRNVVGEEDFESMLEVYINCLHCPRLNRHLLYLLLDYLVEQLFPESTSCEMLQTLLFSNTSLDSYM